MLNPDRHETTIPRPALLLGVAGLVPFVTLPLLTVLDFGIDADWAIQALLTYGAVILSFMGGVQWGLAMRAPPAAGEGTWMLYAASVVPALLGWAALLGFAPRAALLILATGFAGLLAYDVWVIRRGYGPAWYPNLRLGLTAVVVTALCATATLLGS